MDIVCTHGNADLDALASQVAAAKLYPGAYMVRTRQVSQPVRDFLALHKEHFDLVPSSEIDQEKVERLILVDVRRASRLKEFSHLLDRLTTGESSLTLDIYDHHENAPDDLLGHNEWIEPIGSTTTLLVERLLTQEIHLSAIEATLMALGVYSDTGCLTYPCTTVRDVNVASSLLAFGASLATMRYFLHRPLDTEQREAMARLLNRSAAVDLDGVQIGFGVVPLSKKVRGLSEITSYVQEFNRYDALFAIFPIGANVTLIARSQMPYVDVGNVMVALGGGGHPGAGAVILKNTTAEEAKGMVISYCEENPFRPRRVRHIMTTPVHTVSRHSPLDEVARFFETQKISGAPVVAERRLVGVISMRDIRAARRCGRDHLSVSSCMAHEVKSTSPDEPLLRALERMVQADVGRLPVIEGGQIVGILTRSDALRMVYPKSAGQA